MGALLDHLGRACRQARLDAGLRQIDIATEAGTSHASISRFESGKRWPLDPERHVEAYAHECGLRPQDLWRDALEKWYSED
jgi:hypothetical protein